MSGVVRRLRKGLRTKPCVWQGCKSTIDAVERIIHVLENDTKYTDPMLPHKQEAYLQDSEFDETLDKADAQ